MKPSIFLLTCANEIEADKIAEVLLQKKLVVCAKKTPVTSSFLWKEKVNKSNEILLIIESVEEFFNKVETEVRKIHSYELFVLESIPLGKTSKGVVNWMTENLKKI